MGTPATTGQLRTELSSMNIGDYITCKYAANSGTVGVFSNMGGTIDTEIDLNGVTSPNGYFYFVKSDNNLLIADRVIQNSISWDALNTKEMIQGTSFYNNVDSVQFNGTSSYLEIPYNSILAPTTSITVRLQATETDWNSISSATPSSIVSKLQSGGYGLVINNTYTGGQGTIGFMVYANAVYHGVGISLSLLSSGSHEFVGTFDGRYIKFYVDGVLQGTYDEGSTYPITYSASNSLMIGADAGATNVPDVNTYFKGIVNNVSVWNIAQDATTIASTTNDTLIGNETGIVGLWKFTGSMINNGLIADKVNGNNANAVNTIYLGTNLSSYIIRSLTTGITYTNSNNDPITTDQDLGAFPIINEWDTYICKSDLKNSIIAGDDNVWHWSSTYSWGQDTPHLSLGANTNRVCRGKDKVNALVQIASSTTNTTIGFRPVLEIKKNSSRSTTLWY